MKNSYYQKATFLTSAAQMTQLPHDEGMEVAFVGRSNAGKSSALNVLTGQKQLARTSKTPGRTQLINFFALDELRRLVDLPGHGYAKVTGAMKKEWQRLIDSYLRDRHCLKGLVLLMDIRHPLQPFESDILAWAVEVGLPVHILLTKADKLSRGQASSALLSLKRKLNPYASLISIQLFSAIKHIGIDDLAQQLNSWFAISP